MRAPAVVCVALLSLVSLRDSTVSVLKAQQKSPAPIETAAPEWRRKIANQLHQHDAVSDSHPFVPRRLPFVPK